ncbi:MAG: cytochrome c maturation protein CcmE [Candidatus Dormibacteraeota bacterium]|nr:cytochrome c maturation protein CcmE [Candidatus Dormibacteraeota bacterium]
MLLAGLLVIGALAYLVWASLPAGTVYYQTVQELRAQTGDPRPVRVAGLVAAGSIQRDIPGARLQFALADGADRLPVVYHGVVPDIFAPAIEVVVEGQRDPAGVFQAQTLLAKCPSRFQSAIPTPAGARAP